MRRAYRLRNVPVVDIPVVNRRQGRLALAQAGILADAEASIAGQSEDVKIWYQDANMWHRDNEILNQIATNLGMSSDDVDGLFALAKTL